MSDTNLAKSISYKTLAGLAGKEESEVRVEMKKLGAASTIIAQVAGEISGYVVKSGDKGENIAFSGDFVAKSAITGEIFESTKMFFDKGFADQLRGRFDQRKNTDEMVKFSAQITVLKSAKEAGYTYMASPLRTPEAITRRAELLGTLASAPLQIAAKKKA